MFKDKKFWLYLNSTQQKLIKQSFQFLQWAKKTKLKIFDYSFIVMPAAKAYEGFLKKLFYDLGLITFEDMHFDYFRVGKALNPEIKKYKNWQKEFLFEKISQKCGQKTAFFLWQTWKESRNKLFHYFFLEKQFFSLRTAEERLKKIISAMETAFKECRL